MRMRTTTLRRSEGKPAACSAAHSAAHLVACFAKFVGPRRNIHIKWPTRPQLQVSSDDPPISYLVQTSQFNLNNLIRSTDPSGYALLLAAYRTLPRKPLTGRSV